MKVLLFGYGSIGQRHYANLKRLRPDAEIYRHDPPKGLRIIDTPTRYDAAIIASPTEFHGAHMADCMTWLIPFYVEKPFGTDAPLNADRCAVGYQYRFHHAMPAIAAAAKQHGVLHFRANDDLLDRYGPDVDSIMAAHPIDTALWLLGPALSCDLHSNGRTFAGTIQHERGYSTHDYRIDAGPRLSTVTAGRTFDLDANNEMYVDALAAWLGWVEGGARDERTCTLEQGLAVQRVLWQVRHAETA